MPSCGHLARSKSLSPEFGPKRSHAAADEFGGVDVVLSPKLSTYARATIAR